MKFIFLLATCLALSEPTQKPKPPSSRPQPKPTAAAAAVTMPQISASMVAMLRDNADKIHPPEGQSVLKYVDKISGLYVYSGRYSLLFSFREASAKRAVYTPTPDDLADVVRIICGSASRISEIFECSSVSVVTPTGAIVAPLSYDDGPKTATNAMGAKWTHDQVFAAYPIDRLRDGFTVRFSNARGLRWTEQVTAEEAWSGLLLGLPAQ
jgi:uncharacterized membrane protein